MTHGGASIIPWRKDRYAQDEFARPENSTRLGKFLAAAFLLLGLVGLYFLVQVSDDVQRNNDIDLAGWSEDLGTSCPRTELFDNGSPRVFWTHPGDPDVERDRSLPTP